MDKEYKLPKEFAEKWVSALRSGEYKQSKSYLKSDFGYCCLGVGCKLKGHEDFELFGKPYPSVKMLSEVFQYSEHYQLNMYAYLASLNDSGKSFEEIADWIEKNVEFV